LSDKSINMGNKKVLILIGDVGNGHRSAANALTESFRNLYPEVSVTTCDLFKESALWPYDASDEMYKNVSRSKSLEKLNNAAFRLTTQKYFIDVFKNYTFTQFFDTLLKIMNREKPDVVISVHPIVSMVLERLKEDNHAQFLSVVVVTDLVTLFRGWGDRSADLTFAPTVESVETLVKFGVDRNKIIYPLFPINPKLKNYRTKQEVFYELGFDLDKTTILLTGGGVGAKSLNTSIEKLSKNKNYQLIIIAGKLEEYKAKLEKTYADFKNIKILGYVNNIQDYINAADIVVGKPGPATILEIELFNKKAVLTRKIGEQEIGNIGYALKNSKFRHISDNWKKLESAIKELDEIDGSNTHSRRSFDECDTIVKEIYCLLNKEQNYSIKIERKGLEKFLATTAVVSLVALGMYKIVRTITKK
jgi:1,2-diacylglycerol 3-beta-galactosyltransferase